MRLAYATNPQLLAQRAALRNLDESYVQARGALGPQVSVTAQVEGQDAYVDQPGSPFTPATTANSKARTDAESLSISQVLYNGGQSASAINAATADILTGRQQLRSAEIQLMQQVVTAYATCAATCRSTPSPGSRWPSWSRRWTRPRASSRCTR